MTDYKQLCAELLEAYENQLGDLRFDNRLAKRAREALAEPEPAGPTDEELLQVFDTVCLSEGGTVDDIHLRGLRAILALWGK